MDKEFFIKRYSDLHDTLIELENEIDAHLKNKSDLLCDDHKLADLRRRSAETIQLLENTRAEERRSINSWYCYIVYFIV